MKAPKKYECISCRYVSDRHKQMKFTSITFAVCYKCQGRLKEREEWLDWLYSERAKSTLWGGRE